MRKKRSHTNSGPGRYSGIGRIIVDPTTGNRLGVTQPVKRYAVATFGLANLSGTPQPRKYMVQVWDNNGWSDYWPVDAMNDEGARRQANAALAPFWRAKRWRVIPKNTERAVADSAPNAGKKPGDESQCPRGRAPFDRPGSHMSNANDMAFPVLDREQTPNGTFQLGLTKREYIAIADMQGMLANTTIGQLPHTELTRAKRAVEHADALLTELSK